MYLDVIIVINNYRYDMYGCEKDGYRYYEQEQEYVKGSRSQYVHRQLYQLFTSARYTYIVILFINYGIVFIVIMRGVRLKPRQRCIMK